MKPDRKGVRHGDSTTGIHTPLRMEPAHRPERNPSAHHAAAGRNGNALGCSEAPRSADGGAPCPARPERLRGPTGNPVPDETGTPTLVRRGARAQPTRSPVLVRWEGPCPASRRARARTTGTLRACDRNDPARPSGKPAPCETGRPVLVRSEAPGPLRPEACPCAPRPILRARPEPSPRTTRRAPAGRRRRVGQGEAVGGNGELRGGVGRSAERGCGIRDDGRVLRDC